MVHVDAHVPPMWSIGNDVLQPDLDSLYPLDGWMFVVDTVCQRDDLALRQVDIRR